MAGRSHFARGTLLVIALFAVGGVLLWGMFLAPRATSPPAPRDIPFGVPARTVRLVSYNILHNQRGLDKVLADMNSLAPDIVLLQEVEFRDLIDLAEGLGMQQHHHPKLYERSVNLAGPKASWGNFILSKYPLYEGGSIPNPGGGSFGVWAVAIVDGKRFLVANVHLSATWNANPIHIKKSGENRHRELTALVQAWRERGSPPIVIGGDFNQIPMGNNHYLMTSTWTDALEALGKTDITFGEGVLRTRIDYFLLGGGRWKPIDGGVALPGASDHRPIWLDVAGRP